MLLLHSLPAYLPNAAAAAAIEATAVPVARWLRAWPSTLRLTRPCSQLPCQCQLLPAWLPAAAAAAV